MGLSALQDVLVQITVFKCILYGLVRRSVYAQYVNRYPKEKEKLMYKA